MSRSSSISSASSSTESLALVHPIPPPCSASILRNPLSPTSGVPPAQPTSTRAKIANTIQNAIAGPSNSSPKTQTTNLPSPKDQLQPGNQSQQTLQRKRGSSIVAQVVSISSPPPPPGHPLHPGTDNNGQLHDSDDEQSHVEHAMQDNDEDEQRPRGRWSRSNSLSEGQVLPGSSTRDDEGGRLLQASFSEGPPGGIESQRRSSLGDQKLKFAPLPPGRRQFRSNSLTLGVAARAKMIQAQGGSPNYSQARYAGPQQWYQPGAPMPDDVYTYKDVQRGLNKIWRKVSSRGRRDSASSNNSNTSSSSNPGVASPPAGEAQVPSVSSPGPRSTGAPASGSTSVKSPETSANERHAREMESRAKGKHKEIEHIEEVDEDEHDDEDEDENIEGDGSSVDDLSTRVGMGLGLDVGRVREPSPPPPMGQSLTQSPTSSMPEYISTSGDAAEDRDSSSAASVVSDQVMTPEDMPYTALPPSMHQAHTAHGVDGDALAHEHAAAFSKADKGKGVVRNGGITVG